MLAKSGPYFAHGVKEKKEPNFADIAMQIHQAQNTNTDHKDDEEMIQRKVRTGKIFHQTASNAKEEAIFIKIETLEKGGIFGIIDKVFDNQPNLSLVSNGADCILISKQFYLKHANETGIKYLQKKMRPYPKEEILKKDVDEKLKWSVHRNKVVEDTYSNFKKRRHQKEILAQASMGSFS